MIDIAVGRYNGNRVNTMTSEERRVVFDSSLGTFLEWYDIYL